MLVNRGKRATLADAVLSDEEFEEIQRKHYGKKKGRDAQVRSQKSLKSCLDAIGAFRQATGISPISLATPDDCERFQAEALSKTKNWRHQYRNGRKEGVGFIAPNTIIKWSRELQAAFERVNRNAGKKCVRGVVDSAKLLESNPWKQFTWIDGTPPHKRRFTSEELASLLDYFETNFPGVVAATLFAKATLWLWARRAEVASLRWDSLRIVTGQYHFDFVGKRAVRKWARIPVGLYRELSKIKTDSPYVFAAYNGQLRGHHAEERPVSSRKVGQQFNPTAFADWFHAKLVAWSKTAANGHATQHAFRKTGLQFAYRGGLADSLIASDASITESVMHGHYVDEMDEELLLKSNRTFDRIVSSLPAEVAERYGYSPGQEGTGLDALVKAAIDRQDWDGATELITRIKRNGHP
jgi:integrase